MNINHAFEKLKSYSDTHRAKIIINHHKKISWWRVMWYVYLLKHGMPVAKIIHSKWFYGLDFYTNKNTLDPRPDTETLVESVIKDCPDNNPRKILDMGTGTGCIICAVCKNIPNTTGVAIDKSCKALHVARKNIKKLGLKNQIKLKHADFANFKSDEKFDIIVSNPPYICNKERATMEANVLDYEPAQALFVPDDDPLLFYRAIAQYALLALQEGGRLFFEINPLYADDLREMLCAMRFSRVESRNDAYGKTRMIQAIR
jgi:release factor glutamine methyltransferase